MSFTLSHTGPDWPCQVKAPGTRDWERTATRWLRELLPARYSGYATITRHHSVLARHALLQVQYEIRALRVGMQTARSELRAMGTSDTVIENTIRLYAIELEQLNHIARGVRLVTDALLDGNSARRPRSAAQPAQAARPAQAVQPVRPAQPLRAVRPVQAVR
ncbi:hypothetical protein [Wenjunlia tyrosinilytica]|uniref:Uncharacterized protein n=1 Tax=Wenjunlia tyrosinilytica TaxID=1544741 RepID=A0A918DZI7_9ACTN|nr:hypothetical protein [Wenjunlia tyrosinilytica]GGO89958.1 hypothetical protein GCM10012280_34370 [Wenjunlia tyrosinilytica]